MFLGFRLVCKVQGLPKADVPGVPSCRQMHVLCSVGRKREVMFLSF